MKKYITCFVSIVLLITIAGCAELKRTAEILKPTAKIINARLDGINFNEAFLVFDMEVQNPNPVSINLAGLAYDMKLESHSLVSGTTAKGLRIGSKTESKIEVPVTLKFDGLKKLPGKIWNRDEVAYELNTTVSIVLPVVGKYDIQLVRKGTLPIPKLPDISLQSVKLNKLGLTSAEIMATMEVNNPNAFALGLSKIDYKLDVNNKTWGQGNIAQKQRVPKKGKGTIQIPIQLNLLALGSSVYELLSNKEAVDYRLKGGVKLDTGIEMLRNFDMPLDIKGKASIK